MPSVIDENTQFVDSGGKPIVNGFIYIGIQSLDPILNPITIYSDRALTIILANPQNTDADGRSVNKIWIPDFYSMKIEDENNVQKLLDLDLGEPSLTIDERQAANSGNDVLTNHKNLSVDRVTLSTVDIDADLVILEDASVIHFAALSVNLTADITVPGVNGLDTGVEAASTWYYIWVIYNGTTVASLLSLSSTAPTLPSGYTFKGLVGAVFNDSGSDFSNFHQSGDEVSRVTETVLSSGSSISAVSVSLSDMVPDKARIVKGYAYISDTGTGFSKGTISPTVDHVTGIGIVVLWGQPSAAGDKSSLYFESFLQIPQVLYYSVGSTSNDLFIQISGWRF